MSLERKDKRFIYILKVLNWIQNGSAQHRVGKHGGGET